MRIALEKIRKPDGTLVDVVPVPGDTIFPIDEVPGCGYLKRQDAVQVVEYVQLIGGKVVQTFTKEEMLLLVLP